MLQCCVKPADINSIGKRHSLKIIVKKIWSNEIDLILFIMSVWVCDKEYKSWFISEESIARSLNS